MKKTINQTKPANKKQPQSRRETTASPPALSKRPWTEPKRFSIGTNVGLTPAKLDLIDRSPMEQSLRNSELRYRRLFETVQDGILILDAKTGAITDANPYLINLLGYPREEFIEKKLWQVGAFKDIEAGKDAFEALQRNEVIRYENLPLKAKDGRLIQVEFISGVYGGGDEKVIQCNIRDVTEHKVAEKALRESESSLQEILRSTADGILAVNSKNKTLFANDRFVEMWRIPQAVMASQDDSVVLQHVLDQLSDPQSFLKKVHELYKSEEESFDTLYFKDGRVFERLSRPLVQEAELRGRVWSFRDITARKRANEMLLESEIKFRTLFDRALDGILIADLETRRFFMGNGAICRMLGYTHDELSSVGVDEIHPLEHLPNVVEQFNRQARGEISLAEDIPVKRKDGSVFYADISSTSVTLSGHTYMMGIFHDITTRKRAEEALRESEERYRSLFENATIGIYRTTPNGRIELANPTLIRMLGYTTFEELAQRDLEQEGFEPSYPRAQFRERIDREGEIRGLESAWRTKDGATVFFRENAQAIRDAERMVLHYEGTVEDITERKRAEGAMRQRLAELEAVHTVSTALRTAQTRDEALPILLDETLSALETDAGVIWVYDPGNDELRVAIAHSWFRQFDETPMKPGQGIVGTVFATGQAHITAEFTRDPLVRQPATGEIPAGWSGVCLPIRTGEITVGVLFVAAQLPRQITTEQLKLLESLTGMAGTTLHRMSLHEETMRHLDRLEALHSIDIAISASMDLQVTLNILLEHVKTQLNVDATGVLLLNPHSQTLEYAAGRGFRSRNYTRSRLQLGEGCAGRAVLERRLIHIPNLAETGKTYTRAASLAAEGFVEYYAVPLIAKGEVKGVLEVYHRVSFRPESDWISFLKTLAGQAAIAIDSAQLFENLQRSNVDLALAYDATIEGWSRALDLRDKETEGHTQRVSEITMRLAKSMGIRDAELVHVRRGALLHDIGKMGVPDGILLKPGKLTDEEWEVMRKHPQLAYDMLLPINYLHAALDIPYCHHEKWDGTGYPRGLKGEQIPLAARIFAVVDVWDALRSDRPYRQAWTEDKVLDHIRSLSGTHFDPQVVKLCLESGVLKTQTSE